MEPIQDETLQVCRDLAFDYGCAIQAVAAAAKEAEGMTLLILQKHLNNLCDAHLKALKD